MKRLLALVALVSLGCTTVAAQTGERTIVNSEGVPLVFVFLPDQTEETLDRGVSETLRAHTAELFELAPRSMWRISERAGLIFGYFAGDGNALSSTVVRRRVSAGNTTVRISAADAGARMARWELPGALEPVSLDGREEDWQDLEPVLRRAALDEPVRVERATSGDQIEPDEADLWGRSGSAVRTVKTAAGRQWWFAAVESSTAFAPGTAIHLRVFPQRSRASSAGEIVVAVGEDSGPVVFRGPAGRVELVGQYVLRGSFLEFSVDQDFLFRVIPDPFDQRLTADLATSRSEGAAVEHFTLATLSAVDLFAQGN